MDLDKFLSEAYTFIDSFPDGTTFILKDSSGFWVRERYTNLFSKVPLWKDDSYCNQGLFGKNFVKKVITKIVTEHRRYPKVIPYKEFDEEKENALAEVGELFREHQDWYPQARENPARYVKVVLEELDELKDELETLQNTFNNLECEFESINDSEIKLLEERLANGISLSEIIKVYFQDAKRKSVDDAAKLRKLRNESPRNL